jgi:hypothetical protein
MANRVYTVTLHGGAAAGGANQNHQFLLKNENRTALLKSIAFDIRLATVVPDTILPLEQNTTQHFGLSVIGVQGNFANIFQDFTVPGVVVANGSQFDFYRPGQIKLDSFFIRNNLLFAFNYYNNDALIAYEYFASIIVEIQDLEVDK